MRNLKKCIAFSALLFAIQAMATTYTNSPTYGDKQWKSAAASTAALPTTGNGIGDTRMVLSPLSIYQWNGSSWVQITGGGGGSGNVVGPASSTTYAIARYSSTSGTALSNSSATLSDTGLLSTTNLAVLGLTPSTVPYLDVNGQLQSSSVNPTTLGYLDATSSIQTQLNGKQATGSYITALTGDVTATGPGSSSSTVNSVGGSTASNIHAAEGLANAATNANTPSTIVKRDASGNFSAGTITATLNGNASNVTGIVATANGGTGQNSTAVFPTSGNVLTDANTFTVSNKTLDTSNKYGNSTNYYQFDTSQFSSTGTLTFKSKASIADTVTFLDASGNVVLDTVSQTLSNKSLNDTTNNVVNTSDGSKKLGFDLSGATTSTKTTLKASQTANRTVTLPDATTTLIGANSFNAKGDILVGSGSGTFTNVGVGSDGQVPVADSTQANGLSWKTLQQGAKNYVTYNNFENNSTTGWSKFSATWSNFTPSGAPNTSTGGATIATFNTAGTVLAGSYSLNVASASGTPISAGDGFISQAYTIDTEDQAKVLAFKFYYAATGGLSGFNFTGAQSTSSWAVWIYDVTNAQWIQPAGAYNFVQGSGTGIAQGTFQTPSNMNQFRIAVICNKTTNTIAGAATMSFDDFYVGPQSLAFGPAVSDFQSYAPTVSGLGTGSAASGYPKGMYRRVGDSVEVWIDYVESGTAGSGTSNVTFSLPSGLNLDTTKAPDGTSNPGDWSLGSGQLYTTTFSSLTNVSYNGTTNSVSLILSGSANFIQGTNVPANGRITAHFTAPVTGWSSNTVMSADNDTRVVAMRASSSTGASMGTLGSSGANITWNTANSDTHGAMNTSTGVYTVPVTGYYDFAVQALFSGSASAGSSYNLSLYNVTAGSAIAYNLISNTSATSVALPVTLNLKSVYLTAGTQISTQGWYTGTVTSPAYFTSGTLNFFTVSRQSGPAVTAATESVYASYYFSGGATGIPNGSVTAVSSTYGTWTKESDSHGLFNTTTGQYPVPVPGTYAVNGAALFSNNSSGSRWVYVTKNGTTVRETVSTSGSSFGNTQATGPILIKCVAGDTLGLSVQQNSGAALTLVGSSSIDTYISIQRVGN